MSENQMAPSPRQTLSGQGVRRISGFQYCKIASINVGTMIGRSREIIDILVRRKIQICCIQETRYKGSSCKVIGDEDGKYKFFWSGEASGSRCWNFSQARFS